jgi:hypothetical protein
MAIAIESAVDAPYSGEFGSKESGMPRKASKAPGTTMKQARAGTQSLEETIRQSAYELHLERGGAHGGETDDWLRAEREVQARCKSTASGRKSRTKQT